MNPFRGARPHSPQNESDLVDRARNGDLHAFDTLIECHEDRVYNLCLWVLGTRDEACDAAQDAFVRAYRYLHKFRGDSSFGTWLGRIALNVARDAATRRKRAPMPFSALGHDEESQDMDVPAEGPGPAALQLQRERQTAVRTALAGLSENHRLVLVMFELQGMGYEEIAAVLELPVGTIKSRINRARAALREALESERELFDT